VQVSEALEDKHKDTSSANTNRISDSFVDPKVSCTIREVEKHLLFFQSLWGSLLPI
jgi:hypothetical protein